jgi:hypothetical protein
MTATIILLGLLICGSTGGEISIAHGMKTIGEPSLRPKAMLRFLGLAFQNGSLWIGICLMAISFYSLLVLLSWHPVSL